MSKSLKQSWAGGMDDLHFLQPYIERTFGCRMLLVDKERDELHAALDQIAGIDAVIIKGGIPYTVAARAQRVKNYASYSLRHTRASGLPTEWQKSGYERGTKPDYFIQAYITPKTIHLGIASYDQLFSYAKERENQLDERVNNDGTMFKVVWWDDISLETWHKYVAIPLGGDEEDDDHE